MAEVLLSDVLYKLAKVTVKEEIVEVLTLYGTMLGVGRLLHNLIFLETLVEGADGKHIVDQRQMEWVMDIMNVAYEIEDAVDSFLLECPEKLPIISNPLCWLPESDVRSAFLYNFEKEIERILGRIYKIKEFRKKYGISTLGEGKTPESGSRLEVKPDNIDYDLGVVGFDMDRDKIVGCLLDEKNKSLAVVPIVGISGIGKTTLARKVCKSNDVLRSFGKPIWIVLSQKHSFRNILRKMAQDLGIVSPSVHLYDLVYLVREALETRRYLIILDGVWAEESWAVMAKVLPDTRNGSRVIITTRSENVAKMAATTYPPYELPLLNEEESLNLFLKKAVPKNHLCPDPTSDLHSLAKQFASKCKGLPLALEVLGSLLSIRQYNVHEWKKWEAMSWRLEGSDCMDVIMSSYEYLPFAEKLCFLYFAAFPEDFQIKAKALIRMWVAEKFIPHENARTLEEIAECFLEDLVQRSMVQVSGRYPDGSIKYCRMHGVMRDLAVQKAKEMNFLMVCSKPSDWKSCSKARRVAIHYSHVNELIGNHESSNVLRSLFVFGYSSKLDCSYKMLRVLANIEGAIQLQNFEGLPHLRYLQLQTGCIYFRERDFGVWVRSMKKLETLDLRESSHGDLSQWIWQVHSLRHVLVSPLQRHITQGPPASADLRRLQTLRDVEYRGSWETSRSADIPEVRELCIHIPKEPEEMKGVTLERLLRKLKHVVHLKMQGDTIDLLDIAAGGFPFYENLKSLVLISSGVPLVLNDGMLPVHLTELQLSGFEFGSDPMPVLEKLGSLNTLRLCGMGYMNNPLKLIRCSRGGFKKLEVLVLHLLVVKEWKIEIGAMPMLKQLDVNLFGKLQVPPELIHLGYLQDLVWRTDNESNGDELSTIYKLRPHLLPRC